MKPTSSNTLGSKTCVPVSSECVIWEGPDISCIGLCKGDTVTSVVYSLAEQLCSIQGVADLSDIDLTCLINVCQATDEPEKNLKSVIELLVSKVCCLADIVENLPVPGTEYVEPVLNLPLCLQYQNELSQTVTQLSHSQFTLVMAAKVCELNTLVNTHSTQISNLETRVTTLENPATSTELSLSPVCVLPSVVTPITTVVSELENQFCQLKTVLGTNNQLTQAVSRQCPDLSASEALSSSGPMSAIPGWNTVVNNVAQSLQNMWLTICDMRNAIDAIRNCCQSDCSDVNISFEVVLINSGGGANLYFSSSSIPVDFINCTGTDSIMTVTDGLGGQYVAAIDLASAVNSLDPVVLDFGGLLNPNVPYNLRLDSCLTNGAVTCQKVTFRTAQSSMLSCGIPQNLNVEIQ